MYFRLPYLCRPELVFFLETFLDVKFRERRLDVRARTPFIAGVDAVDLPAVLQETWDELR